MPINVNGDINITDNLGFIYLLCGSIYQCTQDIRTIPEYETTEVLPMPI